MNLQLEARFGHLTLKYISWITGMLCSCILSLAIDEGKLARNHGLSMPCIREKITMPAVGILSFCLSIQLYNYEKYHLLNERDKGSTSVYYNNVLIRAN